MSPPSLPLHGRARTQKYAKIWTVRVNIELMSSVEESLWYSKIGYCRYIYTGKNKHPDDHSI